MKVRYWFSCGCVIIDTPWGYQPIYCARDVPRYSNWYGLDFMQ